MSLGSVTARNLSLASCYGDNHASGWPTTLWLALFNGNPASTGIELTVGVGGYARLSINNDSTQFAAPSSGSVSNAATWTMAATTGPYSDNFSHWAFMDLASSGNVLDCGPIVDIDGITPITVGPVTAGDQVTFPVGTVVITA